MSDFCTLQEFTAAPRAANTLRLLSFNIQVGIQTAAYHHYLLRSWQHLLPSRNRDAALQHIAKSFSHFSRVSLQDADAGSSRSRRQNQVARVATEAGFPHWSQQANRNLGQFAQHSFGVLTRLPAVHMQQFQLTG